MQKPKLLVVMVTAGIALPVCQTAQALTTYTTQASVSGSGTASADCIGSSATLDYLYPGDLNSTSSSTTSPTYSHAEGSGTVSAGCSYTVPGSGTLTSYDTSTSGSSWSTAGIGVLHAYATATLDSNYTGGVGGTPSSGKVHADARWYDALTVTSGTLSPGTPVDLIVNLHLSGTITNSAAAWGYFNFYWGTPVLPPIESPSESCHTFVDTLPCDKPLTIHTAVGERIRILGTLDAWVQVGSPLAAAGVADFSNTGALSIESLTADAGFTADSGAAYAQVPLPAAAWLLGSALLGLVPLPRRPSLHQGKQNVLPGIAKRLEYAEKLTLSGRGYEICTVRS